MLFGRHTTNETFTKMSLKRALETKPVVAIAVVACSFFIISFAFIVRNIVTASSIVTFLNLNMFQQQRNRFTDSLKSFFSAYVANISIWMVRQCCFLIWAQGGELDLSIGKNKPQNVFS